MSKLIDTFIKPDWPAPANVNAWQTTRLGGVSLSPYDSLNVGAHVNDNAMHVTNNRQRLSAYVPTEPVWLNQVHGIRVINAAESRCIEDADASYAIQSNVVCVTMTADCLPVLLCDQSGTMVAAIHAGWRSLCGGVIEATIKEMQLPTKTMMAWLGPAIGPEAFEVGSEVREKFMDQDKSAEKAFVPNGSQWSGDLYLIATQRLQALGVHAIYGEKLCTYSNPNQFFSFRRDGKTGRMASIIWLSD